MPKVFVDDKEPTEKVEMVVEEVKAKPKRKRKPLTEEQKKALVERLAKAREAKKNARAPAKEPAKPKATRKKKSPVKKVEPEKNSYREHQLELASLRQEMENQKLKFEIESLKKSKRKSPIEPLQSIKEEPIVEQEKQPVVTEITEVNHSEPIENSVPIQEVPKPIRKNLANKGNIWDMIRNS